MTLMDLFVLVRGPQFRAHSERRIHTESNNNFYCRSSSSKKKRTREKERDNRMNFLASSVSDESGTCNDVRCCLRIIDKLRVTSLWNLFALFAFHSPKANKSKAKQIIALPPPFHRSNAIKTHTSPDCRTKLMHFPMLFAVFDASWPIITIEFVFASHRSSACLYSFVSCLTWLTLFSDAHLHSSWTCPLFISLMSTTRSRQCFELHSNMINGLDDNQEPPFPFFSVFIFTQVN